MHKILLAFILTLAVAPDAKAQYPQRSYAAPGSIHRFNGSVFRGGGHPRFHGQQNPLGIGYGRSHHGQGVTRFKPYNGHHRRVFQGDGKTRCNSTVYPIPRGYSSRETVVYPNYPISELNHPSGLNHYSLPLRNGRQERFSNQSTYPGWSYGKVDHNNRQFNPYPGANRRYNKTFPSRNKIHYGGGYGSGSPYRGRGYIQFEGGVRVNFGP